MRNNSGSPRLRPFFGEQEGHNRRQTWQNARQHGIAMCSEFVGTTLFLWFAFAGAQTASATGGGVANTPDQVMLTSLSFGFSLLVTVWAFYRISGGLFNPAVWTPFVQFMGNMRRVPLLTRYRLHLQW